MNTTAAKAAGQVVTASYGIIKNRMPTDCAIIATVGGVQLYVSIWLQVFFKEFNPFMYTVGYFAGIAHIALSGLLVHRSRSRLWLAMTSIIAAVAYTMSIGIVYQLQTDDNSHFITNFFNFAAILVVVVWSGVMIHGFCRIVAEKCLPRAALQVQHEMTEHLI